MRLLGTDSRSVELAGTPFYSQTRYQCGPAALTTVLVASGADVDLAEIVDRVYLPERRGSLAAELKAAARLAGRLPYEIDGTLASLHAELRAGRPVLVLQNLGVSMLPRWHFAVVVGIDLVSDAVVLRSGTDPRRLTAIDTFLRTWRRSDYWGMVVLRPDELPARVDKARYFSAIVELEQVGRLLDARTAWETARGSWPDDPIPRFGVANAALGTGDASTAERLYRDLLEVTDAKAAIRNNLAVALAEQGRFDEASRQIAAALASTDDETLRSELLNTQRDIDRQRRQRP